MTTRDSERSLTYEAEFQVREMFSRPGTFIEAYGTRILTPEERKFARVEDIQSYCDKVLAHIKHLQPVTVRVRKGQKKAHYEPASAVIAIPETNRWAMREIVVLHELAHHLTRYTTPSHGQEFRSAFLELLERVLSPEARWLLQVAFHERNLPA